MLTNMSSKSGSRSKQAIQARIVERRDNIVRSAGAILRRNKNGQLRMQEVAEQLGIVKGNIYYYFKDRRDLIYRCHMRCIEMSLAALDEIQVSDGNAEARLRKLLIRHIELIVGSDYGGALLADIDEMTSAQRRHYIKLRDQFEAGVRKLIKEGIAAGLFRKTNIPLAGFAILGSVNWMPKWYSEDGAMKPREIAEWFTEFFIRALKS